MLRLQAGVIASALPLRRIIHGRRLALTPGTRLGPYEIVSALGAGGMGEVYRARDTRLDRTVAIKVLPSEVAGDPDLRSRFEREARAVAALDHPHICGIYDVGSVDGTHYLVMPHLEGQTLAARLEKGPLPIDQALRMAVEIADALDKAHRQGITHRDLKPANIMLTKAGSKLLDFGLAKLKAPASPISMTAMARLATSAPVTAHGLILGTVPYMAPEQVEGKEADARSDIWTLGAVIYEMVTGARPFQGDTPASVIGSILKDDPPQISARQPLAPRTLDHLVSTCLAKEPDQRWQSVADVARELAWIRQTPREVVSTPGAAGTAPVARAATISRAPWITATVLLTTITALAVFGWWRAAQSIELPLQPPVRLDLDLGPDVTIGSSIGPTIALSPDATRVVFVSQGSDGTARLAMRRLDEAKAAQLPGTDGAYAPFFSPDGEWVGFFARGKLKKVRLDGSQPITLCDAPSGRGASWNEDGSIIAALDARVGLSRIPADGGKPVYITEREPGTLSHRWPYVLPGGKNVLFAMSFVPANWDEASIAVVSLENQRKRIILERAGLYARYVPTGHIIYVTRGTLFAVPFDLSSMEVRGTPKPLLEDVSNNQGIGFAQVALSQIGTLIYHRGRMDALRTLQWLGADGRTESLKTEPGLYNMLRVSPDGSRLAVSVAEGSSADIWVYDLQRGPQTRLTTGPGVNASPVWSPDSRYVVFQSQGGISWVSADGAAKPQLLTKSPRPQTPASFTPDGGQLIFFEQVPGGALIQTVPLRRNSNRLEAGEPKLFLQTPTGNAFPALSPDGRWLAYASGESGVYEIYVRAFPDKGPQWQISTGGGNIPRWSRNGNELFYQTGDDARIWVATYSVKGDSFVAGSPRLWSQRPLASCGICESFDSMNGRLVVMVQMDNPEPLDTRSHVTLMLNFFDEVRRRLSSEAR